MKQLLVQTPNLKEVERAVLDAGASEYINSETATEALSVGLLIGLQLAYNRIVSRLDASRGPFEFQDIEDALKRSA
jgi:hypothetical protein